MEHFKRYEIDDCGPVAIKGEKSFEGERIATAVMKLKDYLTQFNCRYMLKNELHQPAIHVLYQSLIAKHDLSLHEYYPCCLLSPSKHRAIGTQFPIWQLWIYDRFLYNQTDETFTLMQVINEAQRYFTLTVEVNEVILEYLERLVLLDMLQVTEAGYRVSSWNIPVKFRTPYYQLRIGLYLSKYQMETSSVGIPYTQLMDAFAAYKKQKY